MAIKIMALLFFAVKGSSSWKASQEKPNLIMGGSSCKASKEKPNLIMCPFSYDRRRKMRGVGMFIHSFQHPHIFRRIGIRDRRGRFLNQGQEAALGKGESMNSGARKKLLARERRLNLPDFPHTLRLNARGTRARVEGKRTIQRMCAILNYLTQQAFTRCLDIFRPYASNSTGTYAARRNNAAQP
ncbi:hypothetical protein B0H16DRAFT_1698381 [Mycena metata]|uniref:Secreted protein n=1 Tax=Mycena metata TaxID=1033252 RepID=A0AAD7HR06_9AGAR|nr:hypothetical protein B0H16DRAFT_1698381 [Mycena metata]